MKLIPFSISPSANGQPARHGAGLLRSAFAAVLLAAGLLHGAPSPAQAQGLPNLGDTEREELSPVMERKLGEQIMRQIKRNRDYLDDMPVQEYLNDLGNNLLSTRPEARGEAQYDFFFFAVRDPMLNAFALPGGFIGVHSGLVLAAQNESELASVMAHEIGHVAQRHIARMLGKQRQDMLIPLAGMILGALAASSSPDAGIGIMMGSQGLAMQRQLNFSREAEREADRIGLDILRDAGYETTGMINFFGRLQQATRGYNDTMPAYLRSHPLTSERIADIEARTRDLRYRQRADGLDLPVIQARMRVLQANSGQGLVEAEQAFRRQVQQNTRTSLVAGNYGLAMVALRQGDTAKAQTYIDAARTVLKDGAPKKGNLALTSLAIEVRLAARQTQEAVAEAEVARKQFPISRGIVRQYADALLAAGRTDDAVNFLRDQTAIYRSEPELFDRLAKGYAEQGRQALQHMALAEGYALRGSLPAALDQLSIARRAPDASFYDQSIIDAREREFKERRLEELKQEKEGL
ncbi:beta-barrel assembly-enhancing protease [Oxalicibacterium flavum]|uniref:beta-barrel assembly-enhancing protease n=1 Tax=Oxalicibacterium flavum TaxID=179467 RepID=UPI00280597AE|nr:M48 family metalloprotease [Oxalicibacterium flavum]